MTRRPPFTALVTSLFAVWLVAAGLIPATSPRVQAQDTGATLTFTCGTTPAPCEVRAGRHDHRHRQGNSCVRDIHRPRAGERRRRSRHAGHAELLYLVRAAPLHGSHKRGAGRLHRSPAPPRSAEHGARDGRAVADRRGLDLVAASPAPPTAAVAVWKARWSSCSAGPRLSPRRSQAEAARSASTSRRVSTRCASSTAARCAAGRPNLAETTISTDRSICTTTRGRARTQ